MVMLIGVAMLGMAIPAVSAYNAYCNVANPEVDQGCYTHSYSGSEDWAECWAGSDSPYLYCGPDDHRYPYYGALYYAEAKCDGGITKSCNGTTEGGSYAYSGYKWWTGERVCYVSCA